MDYFLVNRLTAGLTHRVSIPCQYNKFIVLEKNHITGVAQECRYVRSDEIFPLTYTDDEGAVFADSDYFARFVLADYCQSVGAAKFLDRLPYGVLYDTAFGMFAYQVADYLGISLGRKDKAVFLKPLFELYIIFDYAVMYECNSTRTVRVSVLGRGLSVSGPPGMPYRRIT